MTQPNPWKILSSRTAYQNPWMRIREDSVITPAGAKGIYGVMESNDSVMITALNDKNELYIMRIFSYPAQSWNWELPGGGGDQQSPIDGAKRELAEETGIQAATWVELGKTRVCNGFMTERMTTCLARDLSFGKAQNNPDEPIKEGKFVPLPEIRAMVDRGEINDGQSLTALYLLQRWLDTH